MICACCKRWTFGHQLICDDCVGFPFVGVGIAIAAIFSVLVMFGGR